MKPPLRVPLEAVREGDVALPADAANYATRVHRRSLGDALVVFDPDLGEEADATIVSLDRRSVTVRVGPPRRARVSATRDVTLLQGVGKGDKLDGIVRDATELGATRVVPVLCERSVARPDAARAARWRRIAVEAARQCGRGDAPAIAPPASFDDAVAAEPADALKICMDPTAALPIAVALREDVGAPVVILVGPEGGLTVGEMGRAVAVGFARVTLGPLVLRTETVCAAVLGALLAWPHR